MKFLKITYQRLARTSLLSLAAWTAMGWGLCSSCLDKYPEDSIPAAEAIKTVDDANQAVIGIYSAFKSSALYSGALTLLPDLQCDFLYAVNGYSNTYGDIWRGELLATNAQITGVYASLYGIIGQCNFALEEMDKIKPTLKDDDQLDQLDELYGEAYFARALCYSELIKLFCNAYESPEQASKELGVVLRTHYNTPEELKRASLQASYDFVLSDLDKAAERLKIEDDYPYALYSSGYFSEYTAHALRARVLLYMRRWDEAVTYATKVIDSGYYLLSSANTLYTASESYYQYMWTNDLSTETIWQVAFTTDSYGGALGQIFFNYDYMSYRPDYVPAQWVLDLYDASDLRYSAFFQTLPTGYVHGLTWPLLWKYFGNTSFLSLNILHTCMPKPLRLSEQYLIRAEAYANLATPNYQKAAKDIGTLRAARYSTYGGVPAMSAANAMTIIEEERVKELYMEGFRLMDLKRWHKGFERTPQSETLSNGNALKVNAGDARFTWPIPQHELESPNASIEPNASNH
ncbi:MAG: RagB/SusD family nutrient uptake outer membrane protein [Bacteroidaceae bacterium]|nr:RagB/SusD family nutrient uptake outer membrane protein [Bacteroidaceae bacterium]